MLSRIIVLALLILTSPLLGCRSAAPASAPPEKVTVQSVPDASASAGEQITLDCQPTKSGAATDGWRVYRIVPSTPGATNSVDGHISSWALLAPVPCAHDFSVPGAAHSVLKVTPFDGSGIFAFPASNIAPLTGPITTNVSFAPFQPDDGYAYAAERIAELLKLMPAFKAADVAELEKRERGKSMKEILDLRLLVLKTLLGAP